MKKYAIIAVLGFLIVLAGSYVWYKKNHVITPVTTYITSTEGAAKDAEVWIKNNAKTFTYDGTDLIPLETRSLDCTNCFSSTFTFSSAHSGYGNRDNTITLQVVTSHIIEIIYKNGKLDSVTTDGEFDELNQKGLSDKPLMSVEVYMGNDKKNSNTQECSKVFPVERISDLVKPPHKQTLELLLQGVTKKEKADGYFTDINENVKINSFTLNGGIAHIDFSKDIEKDVTTCKATTVREQITQTLKQFPDVKSVLITVDGKVNSNF